MSLQFIVGGPGSLKSEYVYKKMIENTCGDRTKQYILIVPEQYTMQAQRQLTSMHPGKSIMQIEIAGFIRLAHRVFAECGMRLPDIIDDAGKSMVLRKELSEIGEKLTLYRNKVNQPGFVSEMKSMISEFYQYGVNHASFQEMMLAAEKKPLLKMKIADCMRILEGFQKAIHDRFITSEEVLERFCQVIGEAESLKGAEIIIDGFNGNPFTPVQYRVIRELLKTAERVVITSLIQKEDYEMKQVRKQDLFYNAVESIRKLKEMAKEDDIEILPDIVIGNHGSRPEEIRFLERHFYRYGKFCTDIACDKVHVYSGKNPSEEVQYAVDLMLQLLESGMHCRDIAIISGDLDGYKRDLAFMCKESGIPFFMDQKRSMFDNAYIESIRSALAVLDEDFRYESVMRYCKSGFYPFEKEKCYLFENYLIQTGIRGMSGYEKEWEYLPSGWTESDREIVNEMRLLVYAPLNEFKNFYLNNGTIAGYVEGLKAFLASMKMDSLLEEKVAEFKETGELEKALEYGQIQGLFDELCLQMVQLLGKDKTDIHEFASLLDVGFTEKKIGVIPPALDQVLIGSLERSRIGNVKVLIFLGMNEGIVPKSTSSSGIFSDGDREFLANARIKLAPTAREKAFEDRFLVYYFMTRPSEAVYFTYARTTREGKAIGPSSIILQLKEFFPTLKECIQNPYENLLATKQKGVHFLAEQTRQAAQTREDLDSVSRGVLSYLLKEDATTANLILEGATYQFEPGSIGIREIQALVGTIDKPSVTGLEQYASCAYRYFLSGILGLRERKEHKVEQTDLGNLFHEAIEYYGKSLLARDLSWDKVGDAERKELVKEAVLHAVKGRSGSVIVSEGTEFARNQYVIHRVTRMTERAVWALGEHLRHGDLQPSHYELGVKHGRIDRVDTFDDGKHVYVKIIDYKSGNKTFELSDFYYGLQLQLVLYMKESMERLENIHPDKTMIPAGFFYFRIKDDFRKLDSGKELAREEKEEALKNILTSLRMSGYVNESEQIISMLDRSLVCKDGTLLGKSSIIPVEYTKKGIGARSKVMSEGDLKKLLSFSEKKEQELRHQIWQGEIGAVPYKHGTQNACTYCPYRSICRFDTKMKGAKYRNYPKKKEDEVLDAIRMALEEDSITEGKEE